MSKKRNLFKFILNELNIIGRLSFIIWTISGISSELDSLLFKLILNNYKSVKQLNVVKYIFKKLIWFSRSSDSDTIRMIFRFLVDGRASQNTDNLNQRRGLKYQNFFEEKMSETTSTIHRISDRDCLEHSPTAVYLGKVQQLREKRDYWSAWFLVLIWSGPNLIWS